MIAQKCMHIDETDARKKWKMWKMMQFVMSQAKTSITSAARGGATINDANLTLKVKGKFWNSQDLLMINTHLKFEAKMLNSLKMCCIHKKPHKIFRLRSRSPNPTETCRCSINSSNWKVKFEKTQCLNLFKSEGQFHLAEHGHQLSKLYETFRLSIMV